MLDGNRGAMDMVLLTRAVTKVQELSHRAYSRSETSGRIVEGSDHRVCTILKDEQDGDWFGC